LPAQVMCVEKLDACAPIFHEGDEGDKFYIVSKGEEIHARAQPSLPRMHRMGCHGPTGTPPTPACWCVFKTVRCRRW
jgi:hypothetical protein